MCNVKQRPLFADEEPVKAAEAPEMDPSVEFEKVRPLLLTEEVLEAVVYLKKSANLCQNPPRHRACPGKPGKNASLYFCSRYSESPSDTDRKAVQRQRKLMSNPNEPKKHRATHNSKNAKNFRNRAKKMC